MFLLSYIYFSSPCINVTPLKPYNWRSALSIERGKRKRRGKKKKSHPPSALVQFSFLFLVHAPVAFKSFGPAERGKTVRGRGGGGEGKKRGGPRTLEHNDPDLG